MAASHPLDVSRRVYDLLIEAAGDHTPAMRTWTGETWGPADSPATIVLQDPGALRAALLPPSDLTAGEAYIYDDIDIEGDIVELLRFGERIDRLRSSTRRVIRMLNLLRKLPSEHRRDQAPRPRFRGRLHSRARDRSAVRHHYDTGDDFFELFLDPELVYSCAVFLEEDDTLAEAQRRKLDLICRKMRLEPGQRLLDVGCGWGALVRHAANHYGVEAVGVTLSDQQASEARRRLEADGLADRVDIQVRDYREVAGRFDAISSIGMFEHVGRGQLDTYFGHLHGLLAPDGVLLNHGITDRSRPKRPGKRASFVNTYVFPDGELVPIETSLEAAERAGFEARDVESLRTSYARTLRHWVANLEANRERAVSVADEITYRIWRLYMAGSVVAFETGAISVYQVVYNMPERPWRYGREWAV